MNIWRMFPRTHRKLTKVCGRSRGRTASWQKLKEDPTDARKIDRNLAEVGRKFCRRTESLRKVQPSTSVNLLYIWETIHQLSVHQRYLPSMSVNFLWGRRNFHKLSVHPWDLPSTFTMSVGPFITLCQLSVHLRNHPSTVRASAGPFVNFPCICRTFIQNFLESTGLSVNLCQLSVHPWDLM